MRNLRTPGVYIREVEVTPPPRLRLDITGFVGQTERGPLNYPQPLTSWGEYLDVFGDFTGYSYLAYSVYAFFANDGEKCYVVRVANEGAKKAKLVLYSQIFKITEEALTELKKSNAVSDEVLEKLQSIKNRRVKGERRFIDMFETAIGADDAVKLLPQILKRAGKPLICVEAINEGDWGDCIEVVAEAESSDDLILTELATALPKDNSAAQLKSVLSLIEDGIPGEVTGDKVKLINPRNPIEQEQATIKKVSFRQETVIFENPVSKDKDFPAGSLVLGKGFKLIFRYIRNGRLIRGELFDNLSLDPNHERYFVRVINGDPEEPDYIKRVRDGSSILVRVTDLCEDNAKGCARIAPQVANLSGGEDGERARVEARYFTGYKDSDYFRPQLPFGADPEAVREHQDKLFGLSAYEAVEEIGLVAIPDLIIPDFYAASANSQIPEQEIIFAAIPKNRQEFENLKTGQADMLFHCQKMGERFAILDSPRGAEFGKGEKRIEDWPNNFLLLPSARYGGLYYPWVRQKAADFDGRELFIPPCGHMAGIYSRAEQERGVGKAPANEVLRGAVEFEFCVNDGEQSILNRKGVNCLRVFPGRGLLVWGARTLSLDPPSIYVNIRRVALAIIKHILVNLRWTIFEPNGQQLWNKITASLKQFLNSLFESGALAGATPEEAFFVKCDEETNPPESVDLGRVITEVGFAPERPAEFILVTIKRSPGALSVLER
jgi:hypothetical protein